MDHLDFGCEFKFADENGAGTVDGYASVFNLLDRGGDIVLPGAFKKSLAEWKRKKQPVPMLWHHDPSDPIGVWTELVEDEKGLKVQGQLILDVPQAQNVRALMKGGAVKGISIGYRTKEADIDRQTGARKLKVVELWEASLVTFPMMPEAQVTAVKGEFDPNAWERAFRDEGLSNREAKLATSVARKLVLRDGRATGPAPRDGVADVLMEMRKASQALRA